MRKMLSRRGGVARTSVRLSLQFSFLYSFLTAVIFVGAYWLTDFEVRDWMYDRMNSDAARLSEIYEQKGLSVLIDRIEALAEINFENSRIFQLTDPQGQIAAGNILSMRSGNVGDFVGIANLTLKEPQDEEVTGYWTVQHRIGPFVLLQGTGDHVVAEVLEVLSAVLIGGFCIVIGLGLLVGIWIGRITESRIDQISNTLENVAHGDLDARIPHMEGEIDDLVRVSSSINATLNKLQTLLESQRQISTDIAHDMRTPLQRLRQRLERMESRSLPRQGDTAAALRETDEIISTFNALLRIAQIEANDRRERFSHVDLNDIAETVFDAFEPTAADQGQTLSLALAPGQALVWGDRDLLMQMAANLAENGLRHCPSGTGIAIGVSIGVDGTSLWVSDDGPGLAPSDAEKVFRRFYRGEKSRTSQGHGLGLSMVQAIADPHDASVLISDNRPGLQVTVLFLEHSPAAEADTMRRVNEHG